MYEQDDLEILAAVRSPIQCEGLDRGPQRMAEIAASGAVNPQVNWGDLIQKGASLVGSLL